MGRETDAMSIDAVLSALDLALFERRAAGDFVPLVPPPSWFATSGSRGLAAHDAGASAQPHAEDRELHPFLAHFLSDAEAFWSAGSEGRLKSDVWLEDRGEGLQNGFQACALVLPGKRAVLSIELVRDFGAERQAPLQAARESRLNYERLQKEIEKKEILLHCIVHDLKGPLSGMLGVLSLMKQREQGPERMRELTELGVVQARKQEGMIRTILEVFAAEVSALEDFERDPARAPDVERAARNVVDMLQPAYARKGVGLVLERAATEPRSKSKAKASEPLLVVGHPQRLERVLANLLDNALRLSPQRSTVEVRIRAQAAVVHVAVDDRGPGVSESVRGQLFDKCVQDPSAGGTVGLGLYFCRMNVEQWGGRIGCDPRDGGGSRFWLELPRVLDGRPDGGPVREPETTGDS